MKPAMRMAAALCFFGLLPIVHCAQYNVPPGWLGLALLVPKPPWWNRDWSARRAVSINNAGSALSDVPVMVRLTSSNFNFTAAQSNGSDVCFISGGTSVLSHEKDVYASGNAAFWVRVPSLPSGITTIYMYYGSSSSCPASGSAWESNFHAVYHLSSDPSASVADSTGSNPLTGVAMTAANLVSTGTGFGLTFDGASQYLTAADSASLRMASDMSLEVLYTSNAYTLNAHYLLEKGDSDNDNYALYMKNNGAFGCAAAVGCAAFEFKDAATVYIDSTGTFTLTNLTQHYLSADLNDAGNQIDFYLDGVLAQSIGAALPGNTWAQPLSIGSQRFGAPNFFFAGTMDEVRISASVRGADYYAFIYQNIGAASTPSIGAEESQ